MRLIRGIPHLPAYPNGCALTIGNFDGVHQGHQAVVEKLVDRARTLKLPVVIMIFEPQPLEFFTGKNAPPRLSSLREKIIQLSKLPLDDLVIVRFNQQLADYAAQQFIEEILVKRFNIKHLVIGDDFRFGHDRVGDFAMLKNSGKAFGFAVEDTGSILNDGIRVSSTLIRNNLTAGNLTMANALLGYDYFVCGRVAHGEKLGRTIGFPTANIRRFRKNSPITGVFTVTVTGLGDTEIPAVANVGVRPTVDGGKEVVLEVHLFGFNQDIYGRYVTVHFKRKIRSEQRFPSVDALKTQIKEDVLAAKNYFARQKLEI